MSEDRTMYGHPYLSPDDLRRQAAQDRADAAALRAAADQIRRGDIPASCDCDRRNDSGIPIFLPADLRDNRPELDALALMVRDGCRGVVDLDLEDWRVVADELTYQIARHLAKHQQINLPNLGLLEIAYGEQGHVGRLTLAQEARP